MACKYTLPRETNPISENDFKAFLLNGGLEKLIADNKLSGITIPEQFSSLNIKTKQNESNGRKNENETEKPEKREREADRKIKGEGDNAQSQTEQLNAEGQNQGKEDASQWNGDVLEDQEGGEKQPPKPPSTSTTEEKKEEPSKGERRFTKQLLKDNTLLSEAIEKGIRRTLSYIEQTNAMTVEEANAIMENTDPEKVFELVTKGDDVKGAVRVVLGQALIKKFNQLAAEATTQEDKEYYIDRTNDIAKFVTEKLATEPGQMIQSFSLYSRLSPEAQLRSAVKEKQEYANKRKKKQAKNLKEITQKLQDINEETVNEMLSSQKVKKTVENTENARVKKAKDKIQEARKKRENIINKYKGNKGKNLYSTVGLTSEGIEFVGNLAATYIQEGFYQAEIIAEKIIQELKNVTSKEPPNETVNAINDIIRGQVEQAQNKNIAKGLSELEKAVNKTVREHFTVREDKRENLVNKFIEETGLDKAEAEQLAKEIEAEFDKIATRKKRRLLEQEKKRFDQIKKGLQGSKSAMDIEDKIIKYSNLGAFENEDLLDMLADKLGTGSLTPEQAQKIQTLAEKVEKAPEGSPKREATEDLLKYRADINGRSWGEIAQAIWYANVLSGYKTQIKNFVANFYNSIAVLGTEFFRDPKSLPLLLAGSGRGYRRGLSEAKRTFLTGRSPIHYRKVETPQALERGDFKGGWFNPANYLKYVTRLMVAADVFAFQGLKEMRATQLAYRDAKKMGYKNPFSKAVWDKVNDQLLNTKERYEIADVQATDEGLKGNEKQRRIYELMEASRPIEMTEDAYGFAAKGTFNHVPEGTLGALTNAISAALDVPVGGVRPLRFLVPFTNIITNVANNTLDYSPVGLIRGLRGKRGFESFDDYRHTKGAYKELTSEERAQYITKAFMGIGLTAGLFALTQMKGDDDEPIIDITGFGTGDYKKDAQLRETGWRPFSIKVGGKYHSYALTPMVFMMSILGNYLDKKKYSKEEDEEDEMGKMALALWQSGKLISDMTWIGSTASLMGALENNNPEQMGKEVGRSLENSGKSFLIPNVYTQAAQKVEEIYKLPKKETNNALERMIQDVPIARNMLNDKINALGDPVFPQTDILTSKEKSDPVWDFITEKKAWVAPVNKNTLIIWDDKNKTERLANEDEYYEFSKVRGLKIKAAINDIIKNGVTIQTGSSAVQKTADEMTSAEAKKVLREVATKATKAAKQELFSGEPKQQKTKIRIND